MDIGKQFHTILQDGYKYIVKPVFFKFDPEMVHELIANTGEFMGKFEFTRDLNATFLNYQSDVLSQNLWGINFRNPVGLAAGYDYYAKLTQVLPSVGFGYMTVGTITNGAYEGNPKPRLGRLPKSRSLMVNKGFKNRGAEYTSNKLAQLKFEIPVGVSIGRTNRRESMNFEQSVDDIVQAFQIFEKANVPNSYYELNISCPNLYGNVSFYPPQNLNILLNAVMQLRLNKPIFIKMPIDHSDQDTLNMLEVIVKYPIQAVIFGNLFKDRTSPYFEKDEVAKFSVGNFSGKPTYKRSNELISLAYKYYHEKLTIIGCGGIFSAEDAYEKIKSGASLVQLITGMIFEGPTLIGDINKGLTEMLKRDGFNNISQAVGLYHKQP